LITRRLTNFMDTNLEDWEQLPDDNYDGSAQMIRRGRIQHLNHLYSINNEYENEERAS